tara:strand:- start:307 stop:936 length:630 start_codon:yes stop_codon:yes gene_type:complete
MIMLNKPSFHEEYKLYNQGFKLIAGVDEVGRGTIAGPVLVGVVIFPKNFNSEWINLINDSKQLSEKKRNEIFYNIQRYNINYKTGLSSPEEIDQNGIVKSTNIAIIRAIKELNPKPDFLLLDGGLNPDIDINKKIITKGDNISISIAAASIVAKVTRDNIMEKFDKSIPKYNFGKHKGYLTKMHKENLQKFGPSNIHRKTFYPVTEFFK